MTTPLISIIVPVYKVEKYINRCVHSLQNQTLSEIEIILINDGCPNGCGEIIEKLKNNDNRIRVIHQKNKGQSEARNAGIKIAQGAYIGFVDPDDWIEPEMYEKLSEAIINTKSDLAICGRRALNQHGIFDSVISPNEKVYDFTLFSKQEYLIEKFFYPHTASSCNKLYKKELLDKNNLRFEDVSYVGSEDTLFNYGVLCIANKIVAISDVLYNVQVRDDSTVRTYKFGYMSRTANLMSRLKHYSSNLDNLPLFRETYPIVFLYFHQWNFDRIIHLSSDKKTLEKELKDAMKKKFFRSGSVRITFDYRLTKYIKKLGFNTSGIVYLRIYMVLYLLGFSKLASIFRTMKVQKVNGG